MEFQRNLEKHRKSCNLFGALFVIRSEIKKDVLNIMSDSSNLKLSFSNISLNTNNIFIDRSLYDEKTLSLYEEYRNLDKTVSNSDFYDILYRIDDNVSIEISLDINRFITKSDVEKLKKELRKLVSYIQDFGYVNYDINLSFDNYQRANVTRYIEDDKEKIYLIFDYENYSDIDEEDKLQAYIFDK